MKKASTVPYKKSVYELRGFGRALLGDIERENALKILEDFKLEIEHLKSKLPPSEDHCTMNLNLDEEAAMANLGNYFITHHKTISSLKDILVRLTILIDRDEPLQKIMVDTLVSGIIDLNSDLESYSVRVIIPKQKMNASRKRGGDIIKSLVEKIFREEPKAKAKELWPQMHAALEDEFETVEEFDGYKIKVQKTWGYRYLPHKGNIKKTLSFGRFSTILTEVRNNPIANHG